MTKLQKMNFSICGSFRLTLIRYLPQCCLRGCLKRSTTDDFFLKGYNKFRKEIQITNIIKELRVIKAATQSLIEEKQWSKFKKEA